MFSSSQLIPHIASTVQERWLMAIRRNNVRSQSVPCEILHSNMVVDLVGQYLVSGTYYAVVKSPLTYDDTITKSNVAFIVLMWTIPIPLSIGPSFFGFAKYVYNPEVFFCEQR